MRVGQKLWFVSGDNRKTESEVSVTAVGRKWVTLSNGERIDMADLVADGGNYASPGRAWLTREDWQRESERRSAWNALREKMNNHFRAPESVSTDDIVRANALLGFARLR